MTSAGHGPLSEDEQLVATAVYDMSCPVSPLFERLQRPATAAAVAHDLSLHARFGVARASRALGALTARGLIRRTRPKGSAFVYHHVRWPTDEERG